jgi:hypothetical protein
LAGLRQKEKWLEYAEALKEGVTIEKAAERCGVDPTTAKIQGSGHSISG